MSNSKTRSRKVSARIVKAIGLEPRNGEKRSVKKAEISTQVDPNDVYGGSKWIEPPVNLQGYKTMVTESSILPQCISAYKSNIAGFGIGIRYKEDTGTETEQMKAEYTRATDIINLLNIEQDTKEVFEDVIEGRETYGISYIEVIRNLAGEVVQIEYIRDIPTMRMTRSLEPYADYTYFYNGMKVTRRKKFRKYRQQVGGKTVYYKEFGDARIMNKKNGEYLKDGETLDVNDRANEIMEFTIGTMPYGEVRWQGQLLGVDGSRRAENLNNNYFINGRHTPLMIMVNNGTLTYESWERLQEYMNDIKGENGQHSFILLESESAEGQTDFDDTNKPSIEVKDIASILQKDELFQEYLDNNRRRIQSSFRLPDLYTGYTTDFNRATAQTAKETTEEQVFQPERISLAWAVNNKLLNGYGFKYVEAYFMDPNITNPDDLYKIMTVANNAGGLTPNKAKEVLFQLLGETSDDYDGEWGGVPLSIWQSTQSSNADISGITALLTKQIRKAEDNEENHEVVSVMKSVYRLLEEIKEGQGDAK